MVIDVKLLEFYPNRRSHRHGCCPRVNCETLLSRTLLAEHMNLYLKTATTNYDVLTLCDSVSSQLTLSSGMCVVTSSLILAVSSSPKPWIAVYVLPEKKQNGGD